MLPFFSKYALLWGFSMSAVSGLCLFLWEWLGRRWNIRLLKSAVFTSFFGKTLHHTERNGTRYSLGFFAFNSHVLFWGMGADEFDGRSNLEPIAEQDYPRTYLKQSLPHRAIIRLLPLLLWFVVLSISCVLVNHFRSPQQNLMDIVAFLRQFFEGVFTGSPVHYPTFVLDHSTGLSLYFYGLCIIALWGLFAQVVTLLELPAGNGKIGKTIYTVAALAVFAAIVYLGYRLFAFFAEMMPLPRLLRYIANLVLGTYLGGALVYALRIFTLPKPGETDTVDPS